MSRKRRGSLVAGLPELDAAELDALRAWAKEADVNAPALAAQGLSGVLSGASAALAVCLAAHVIASRIPVESLRFAPRHDLGGAPRSGPAEAILVSSTDPGGAAVCTVVSDF